jgi:hypothetical protein
MTDESQQDNAAKRLLEAVAETNKLLKDHAVQLRRNSIATNARTSLEAVSYTEGPVLEGYVEAELPNGDSVCWCLDIRWNEHSWIIEATLDRKSGDRQRTVKELPSLMTGDLESFLNALRRMVRELLALSIEKGKQPESLPQIDSTNL